MSSSLTPAQHAQIRWQLILIPVYVWFVYGWATLFTQLPITLGVEGGDNHFMRDFATFYTQGVIANEHNRVALYDINEQSAVLRRVVPGKPEARYPTIHGPQVAMLFGPLAHLPYSAAMWTWLAVTFVIYGSCGYAVWRVCPRLHDKPWSVFWLLLAAPGLRFDVAFAQTAAIGLLCVTGAFFAFRARRPWLAGFAIGSLFYKPQLGLAAAFVFLFAGEWRVVLGALVAVSVQVIAAAIYWGPSIFVEYVTNLRRLPDVAPLMEPFKFHMHSWRAFFDLLGLPPLISLWAYLAAAGVTAIAALVVWRGDGPLRLRYSALLIATVLINPHMWVYDFIILTPALLLVWDWALEQLPKTVRQAFPTLPIPPVLARKSFSGVCQILLYFCYLSPVFGAAAEVIRLQVSVLGLSALGWILLRQVTTDRPLRTQVRVRFPEIRTA